MFEVAAQRQIDQLKERYAWVFDALQDRSRLRLIAIGAAVFLGMAVVYNPMNEAISRLRKRVAYEQQRLELVRDVEGLRSSREALLKTVPDSAHANFWTEYVLGGLGDVGVQLRHFETNFNAQQSIGSYRALELNIEVSGEYRQVYELISWIESSPWYMRIMDVRFRRERSTLFATLKVGVLASEGATVSDES